jgi:hypothetical protein
MLEDAIAEEVAKRVAPLLADRIVAEAIDPLLKPEEAARYLNICTRNLDRVGVDPVYPTPGAKRFRLSDLNNHIKSQK